MKTKLKIYTCFLIEGREDVNALVAAPSKKMAKHQVKAEYPLSEIVNVMEIDGAQLLDCIGVEEYVVQAVTALVHSEVFEYDRGT